MRTKILFLLISLFVVTASLQVTAKQLTAREQEILKIEYKLDADTVIESMRKWDADMRKSFKDDKPLEDIRYDSFVGIVAHWMEYRWLIADTGLSEDWLKDVKNLLLYMSKARSYLSGMEFNGRTKRPEYQKALKYFDVAYKRFNKLIQKPVKVSSKIQRKAQLQKVLWQKEMRKKYKIDKREKPPLL